MKRDNKYDVVVKYISCPKYRARMKAHSFGNLLDHINGDEVHFDNWTS